MHTQSISLEVSKSRERECDTTRAVAKEISVPFLELFCSNLPDADELIVKPWKSKSLLLEQRDFDRFVLLSCMCIWQKKSHGREKREVLSYMGLPSDV